MSGPGTKAGVDEWSVVLRETVECILFYYSRRLGEYIEQTKDSEMK